MASTPSLISAVLGTRLPGPVIYIAQTLNFRAPVKIGDTVTMIVTVAELMPEKSRARLTCVCKVGRQVVLDGEALVKVPPGKGQAADDAVVGWLRRIEPHRWTRTMANLCKSLIEP